MAFKNRLVRCCEVPEEQFARSWIDLDATRGGCEPPAIRRESDGPETRKMARMATQDFGLLSAGKVIGDNVGTPTGGRQPSGIRRRFGCVDRPFTLRWENRFRFALAQGPQPAPICA